MSELNDQLKALRGKLNAENDLGGQRDMSKIADLEQQIADLNIQVLAENQAQQAEGIAQAQAEKLDSITLPFDFNEVFEDPRANEMIVELIKEFQAEANEEYNAKLKDINAGHLEELRAATDRELQLKRQNDELQGINDHDQNANDELQRQNKVLRDEVSNLRLELEDMASKRDAAVAKAEGIELLLSEKEEHINKLREEIAIGAKAAVNVTNISPTDRLAALVEQSKNARVKSALDIALENAAPFRGKVIKDGEVVAPLYAPEVPTFQTVDTSSDTGYQLVTGPVTDVPADDQVTPSGEGKVQALPDGLGESNAGETGEGGKTLEERVKALEGRMFELELSLSDPDAVLQIRG